MISHPHYYTTYANWARAFNCPIYISADDQEWLCQKHPTMQILRLTPGPPGPAGVSLELLPGVSAIKTGGHFPGSLVLHWEKKLFIADTIVTVPVSHASFFSNPTYLHSYSKSFGSQAILDLTTYLPNSKSAYTPHPRPPGQTSYSFQWSIPNMIPLPPSEILQIWKAIVPFDFDTTHGAFLGMDVRDAQLKKRMLESMKIQTKGEGWERHEILDEVI